MMKYLLSLLLIIAVSSLAEAPPSEKKIEFIIFMPEEPPVIKPTNKTEIIKDLAILHPAFRNKVIKLLYECKKAGIELKVVETYRTPERQNKLKKEGFSMLHGGRSKHQYNIAVDVVPVKYGWYMWHDKELWQKVGKIGKAQGLIWGGDWKRFRDYPHFEYPISIDSLQFLKKPDTVLIPLNY